MSPRLRHPDLRSAVEVACPAGHAAVLRCDPVREVDGRVEPFPTLFWLICPVLVHRVSALEHDGWIGRLTARVDRDAELRARFAADHAAYRDERCAALTPAQRARLDRQGLLAGEERRGIGGIRDWRRVKCLHLHYAHHLARGNVLGALLDAEDPTLGLCPDSPAEGVNP